MQGSRCRGSTTVLQSCNRQGAACGIGAGIHFWLGLDQEFTWAKAGGNLVMHSSDLATFNRTLKSEIEQLRKSLQP